MLPLFTICYYIGFYEFFSVDYDFEKMIDGKICKKDVQRLITSTWPKK